MIQTKPPLRNVSDEVTVPYNGTLTDILSQPKAAIKLCQRFNPDIKFTTINGVTVTVSKFLEPLSGKVKPPVSIYHDYKERVFIRGADFGTMNVTDNPTAATLATGLGLPNRKFFGSIGLHGVMYAFTPVVAVALLITNKELRPFKGSLKELNNIDTGLRGRREVFAMVDDMVLSETIAKGVHTGVKHKEGVIIPMSPPRVSSPGATTSKPYVAKQKAGKTTTRKAANEIVAVKSNNVTKPPAVTSVYKQELDAPVVFERSVNNREAKFEGLYSPSVVYCDGSLHRTENGSCAIAAFHPNTMRGEVKVLDGLALDLATLEMLAIALGYKAYPQGRTFYTDNKAAEDYWIEATKLAKHRDEFVYDATHKACYILRDVAMNNSASVKLIPRSRNIVADYLCVWANKNAYSGPVQVQLHEKLDLDNPNPVRDNWITVIPVVGNSHDRVIRELTLTRDAAVSQRDKLTVTIQQLNDELDMLSRYANIKSKYNLV